MPFPAEQIVSVISWLAPALALAAAALSILVVRQIIVGPRHTMVTEEAAVSASRRTEPR